MEQSLPRPAPSSPWAKLVQVGALVALLGIVVAVIRLLPDPQRGVGMVAGLGVLLLAGVLLGTVLDLVGLPHLSAYLIAGLVAGPHVLHVVDHQTVRGLGAVNALALALIALAGGAELRLDAVRAGLRSLTLAMVIQTVVVGAVAGTAFVLCVPLMPFSAGLAPGALVALVLVWGTLATTRSPAAVLGILTQLRPRGPLTTHTLGFVMSSDVVVVVLMALVMAGGRVLMSGSTTDLSGDLTALVSELVGSTALGMALGVVLALYLRFIGRALLLVLLMLGLGLSALLRYVHYDPLLAFMVAGFVVQNFSAQGETLRQAVERTGAVVFVMFFAIAGAEIDLPLLTEVWPVALILAASRAGATIIAARVASGLAGDPPAVKRWGWSGLISQAGLTLGLSLAAVRLFPEFGEGLRTIAIAVVAINELVGPALFKLGLDRAGEASPPPESNPEDSSQL